MCATTAFQFSLLFVWIELEKKVTFGRSSCSSRYCLVPIEIWFISTSTQLPCQKDRAKKMTKKKGSTLWPKRSVPWSHLWLKCKLMISAKEKVLEECCSILCALDRLSSVKVIWRGMFLTLLLSPLLETWFIGTSTCILCQNDLGEQKNKGSMSWQNWSIPWPNGSSANLWGYTSAKEKSSCRRFFSYVCTHNQQLPFLKWLCVVVTNLLGRHFPYLLWTTIYLCIKLTCKWCSLLRVDRMVKWTDDQ